MNSYNSTEGAKQYLAFINSEDGLIEQKVLLDAISPRLDANNGQTILDAGCGQGWLAGKLSEKYKNIYGCDASEFLVAEAKKNYPVPQFVTADLTKTLPYDQEFFHSVVVNMALHDVSNPAAALKNIFAVLKPGGRLIMTIANPYYAYPVGVWKRGIIGRLLFQKPKLKIRPYNLLRTEDRKFKWGNFLTPYFYPLSEQINTALSAGFALTHYDDLAVSHDSPKFNLQYQLYRFPYILLLEFKKSVQ